MFILYNYVNNAIDNPKGKSFKMLHLFFYYKIYLLWKM